MKLKRMLTAGRLLGLAVIALVVTQATPVRATPAGLTFTVNTNATDAVDANPGDGVCAAVNTLCTLRAAVTEANAWPGADTIVIPPGTYLLHLVAAGYDDYALNGDLDLTDDVTVLGASEAGTIIDGNGAVTGARVFSVAGGVTAAFSNLTIRGSAIEPGPAISGGLLNLGTVTLEHVTLTANDGGGFDNLGTATLRDVTYRGNTGYGAGLLIGGDGSTTILNSTIADNTVIGPGGGLWQGSGHLTLIDSVVSGNQALGGYHGGGLIVYNGTATIINTTFSGNRATGSGGGLYLGDVDDNGPLATVELYNVTVTNNLAAVEGADDALGGGVFVEAGEGVLTVTNSLIANNRRYFVFPVADDCAGALHLGGYNLLKTTTGCTLAGDATGLLTGQDPLLSTLGGHGGDTDTHALLVGSPAIAAGNPAGCANSLGGVLTTDQRGFFRAGAGRCDLGAYEFLAPIPRLVFVPFVRR